MNVLGLIPARGGSRGIPDKNIVSLAGKPLISYSIDAALASKLINRTIVSTDDQRIADICMNQGAEVPFMRPDDLARDQTPALEVIRHAVHHLNVHDNWSVDVVVYLQPTSPLRNAGHIDRGVELLLDGNVDTVVSVVEVPHQYSPDSLMTRSPDGTLKLNTQIPVLRRQDKHKWFARNGPALLVMNRDCINDEHLYQRRTRGLEMDAQSSVDIDTPDDLILAECLLKRAIYESSRC